MMSVSVRMPTPNPTTTATGSPTSIARGPGGSPRAFGGSDQKLAAASASATSTTSYFATSTAPALTARELNLQKQKERDDAAAASAAALARIVSPPSAPGTGRMGFLASVSAALAAKAAARRRTTTTTANGGGDGGSWSGSGSRHRGGLNWDASLAFSAWTGVEAVDGATGRVTRLNLASPSTATSVAASAAATTAASAAASSLAAPADLALDLTDLALVVGKCRAASFHHSSSVRTVYYFAPCRLPHRFCWFYLLGAARHFKQLAVGSPFFLASLLTGPQLESLDMRGQAKVVGDVGELLRRCPLLAELNLFGCERVGGDFSAALAEPLPDWAAKQWRAKRGGGRGANDEMENEVGLEGEEEKEEKEEDEEEKVHVVDLDICNTTTTAAATSEASLKKATATHKKLTAGAAAGVRHDVIPTRAAMLTQLSLGLTQCRGSLEGFEGATSLVLLNLCRSRNTRTTNHASSGGGGGGAAVGTVEGGVFGDVASLRSCGKLVRLHLGNCGPSVRGDITALIGANCWPRLEALHCCNCPGLGGDLGSVAALRRSSSSSLACDGGAGHNGVCSHRKASFADGVWPADSLAVLAAEGTGLHGQLEGLAPLVGLTHLNLSRCSFGAPPPPSPLQPTPPLSGALSAAANPQSHSQQQLLLQQRRRLGVNGSAAALAHFQRLESVNLSMLPALVLPHGCPRDAKTKELKFSGARQCQALVCWLARRAESGVVLLPVVAADDDKDDGSSSGSVKKAKKPIARVVCLPSAPGSNAVAPRAAPQAAAAQEVSPEAAAAVRTRFAARKELALTFGDSSGGNGSGSSGGGGGGRCNDEEAAEALVEAVVARDLWGIIGELSDDGNGESSGDNESEEGSYVSQDKDTKSDEEDESELSDLSSSEESEEEIPETWAVAGRFI